MTAGLVHRGPDFGAVKSIDDFAVLGHRRLSIIDLSAAANQPMTDASNRFTIVYNGEVYNFDELRKDLRQRGYVFKSSSDTEVVLNSFAEWGAACFDMFNGMFALAIWDSREKQLVCARDRFGKKPFYYTIVGDEFSFASELSALLLDDAVRNNLSVSTEALNHFLALGYILSPRTLYREVCKLEPASFLRFSEGKTIERVVYWNYGDSFRKRATGTRKDMADTVEHLLRSAVARRLVADVPVGTLLSGGLDSSAVSACAQKESATPISTFSVGFEQKSYDESAHAAFVAKHLGTRHHEISVDIATEPDFITSAIRCFDEPFADTSLVPMAAVARFAASQVKVVLSGDGADEIFGGYLTYAADALHGYISRFIPRPGRSILASLLRNVAIVTGKKAGNGFKMRQFGKGIAADYRYAHYSWRELFSEEQRISLLGRDKEEEIRDTHPFGVFQKHYDAVADLDLLSQHLYVDAKTWLADDILVKVDRTTMAYSLEARCPFLDAELAEYAAGIPSEYKTSRGTGKRILREAVRGLLPNETIAKKKSGFGAPVGKWLGKTSNEDEYTFFVRHVAAVRNLFGAPNEAFTKGLAP
jgi:asparagine synthase (glutamine-hydrolysing)